MIRISMVHGSLTFTFTKPGLATLAAALESVLKGSEFTIPGLPFAYAGKDRTLDLVLGIKDESCFKVTKQALYLSLDPEDVEDSLERFNAAKDLAELYPEWLQALNLATKKHSYIYVSMEPG